MNEISQLFIGVFGVTAIWLSQQTELEKRKWASVCGLAAQPFWFYSMYASEQWGVFLLCFFYAFSWSQGFYNYWLKK